MQQVCDYDMFSAYTFDGNIYQSPECHFVCLPSSISMHSRSKYASYLKQVYLFSFTHQKCFVNVRVKRNEPSRAHVL